MTRAIGAFVCLVAVSTCICGVAAVRWVREKRKVAEVPPSEERLQRMREAGI